MILPPIYSMMMTHFGKDNSIIALHLPLKLIILTVFHRQTLFRILKAATLVLSILHQKSFETRLNNDISTNNTE